MNPIFLIVPAAVIFAAVIACLVIGTISLMRFPWIINELRAMSHKADEKSNQLSDLRDLFMRMLKEQQHEQQLQRERFDKNQFEGIIKIQQHISTILNQNTEQLTKQVHRLTENTDQRLKDISGQVEKRLSEGFEKTTAIFSDVIKRLALIDQAQQKLTELSGSMMSLQEVLADKRSRGAFGEVQLSHIIHNVLPEQHFALQHTLSNGKRVDAMLFLPEPTGNIAVDAKFPLERYRELQNQNLRPAERKLIETQFRIDIRLHIDNIATKYIVSGETSDGAVMFIPAEAVFAEIHAHFPELIDFAHTKRVWVVSPTTMMAILTTARAVVKDAATRKQVHIIQEHLAKLSEDFGRFQKRMDNLSRHITQAQQDVEDIHKSSRKITHRFNKIEKVELDEALEVALIGDDEDEGDD